MADELNKPPYNKDQRIINIVIALVIVGIFWAVYEISSTRILDLQFELSEVLTFGISQSMWSSLNSIFIFPISLVAIIIWTYFYSSHFFKLMIGFIFGAISFGILFLIPEIPTEQDVVLYLGSLFFLSVSEIHIAPIIHSILTQYSNPKYLAILISLAFIPTRLFSVMIGFFNDRFYDNPIFGLIFGIVVTSIISIGLIIFVCRKKKTSYNTVS